MSKFAIENYFSIILKQNIVIIVFIVIVYCFVSQMYQAHSAEEYNRRNEDINPLAAQAEYELEKRIEKMDQFEVKIDKSKKLIWIFMGNFIIFP